MDMWACSRNASGGFWLIRYLNHISVPFCVDNWFEKFGIWFPTVCWTCKCYCPGHWGGGRIVVKIMRVLHALAILFFKGCEGWELLRLN